MAINVLSEYLETLRSFGWKVARKPENTLKLKPEIFIRYPNIPENYLDFLQQVELCMNMAENAWFFTENDFNRNENDSESFKWNTYERMSLEATDGDEELTAQIIDFWNKHLPIAYAVHSDYAYLAISLTTQEYGAIVYGYGPMFEDTARKVSTSFDNYLESHRQIITGEVSPSYVGNNGQTLIKREFKDFL